MSRVNFESSIKTNGSFRTSNAQRPAASERHDAHQIAAKWKEVSSGKEPVCMNPPLEEKDQGKENNDKKLGKQTKTSKEGKIVPEKGIEKNGMPNALDGETGQTDSFFGFDDSEPNSPFALFNKMEERRMQSNKTSSSIDTIQVGAPALEESISALFPNEEHEAELYFKYCDGAHVKDQEKVHYHEDLSFMNPLAGPVHIASLESSTDGVVVTKPTAPMAEIDELVNQLVDQVDVMKHDGRTETTIHIKNSSLFSGAKVTITEFDTAHKQLSIKFDNLTQKAHEIISMQHNREALKGALEQKGYNVQLITAKTEIEATEHTFKGHQDRSGSDRRDQRQEQQQKRQR